MEIIECETQNYLEEIKTVKKKALKDADAYDEEDEEPDYSNFDCFLICQVDDFIVGTVGFRQSRGDVVKNLEVWQITTRPLNKIGQKRTAQIITT